jgi:gluconokinase
MVFVIMGVSGCGKSTVGVALAEKLDCPFYDGDDYHPPENVAKMASGIPLNDVDRHPWLAKLHDMIGKHLERGETAVVACSALKKKYRRQLRKGNNGLQFIFLKGSFELIWSRMSARQNHYMKAEMLRSQFETLEEPDGDEALVIGIENDVESIVEMILAV